MVAFFASKAAQVPSGYRRDARIENGEFFALSGELFTSLFLTDKEQMLSMSEGSSKDIGAATLADF